MKKLNTRAEFTHITRQGNALHVESGEVVDTIEPGYYRPNVVMDGLYLNPVDMQEQTVVLDENQEDVLGRMLTFFKQRDDFVRYGLPHQRKVLLYGPPGTGKTTILRACVERIVTELRGHALVFTGPNDFIMAVHALNDLVPDRPLLVTMEDVDDFEKRLTSLFDSPLVAMDNVFFLATTNHIGELSGRVRNRPSRIDEKLFIGYPGEKVREGFIKTLITDVTKDQLDLMVKFSEDMSLAHVKELLIQAFIHKVDAYKLQELSDTFRKQCKENLQEYGAENGVPRTLGLSIDLGTLFQQFSEMNKTQF